MRAIEAKGIKYSCCQLDKMFGGIGFGGGHRRSDLCDARPARAYVVGLKPPAQNCSTFVQMKDGLASHLTRRIYHIVRKILAFADLKRSGIPTAIGKG
jgi:hypothetical protein